MSRHGSPQLAAMIPERRHRGDAAGLAGRDAGARAAAGGGGGRAAAAVSRRQGAACRHVPRHARHRAPRVPLCRGRRAGLFRPGADPAQRHRGDRRLHADAARVSIRRSAASRKRTRSSTTTWTSACARIGRASWSCSRRTPRWCTTRRPAATGWPTCSICSHFEARWKHAVRCRRSLFQPAPVAPFGRLSAGRRTGGDDIRRASAVPPRGHQADPGGEGRSHRRLRDRDPGDPPVEADLSGRRDPCAGEPRRARLCRDRGLHRRIHRVRILPLGIGTGAEADQPGGVSGAARSARAVSLRHRGGSAQASRYARCAALHAGTVPRRL